MQHLALRKLIAAKSNTWFGRDRRYPAVYEPGGDDFLSAGLVEAALMLRLAWSMGAVTQIGGSYSVRHLRNC